MTSEMPVAQSTEGVAPDVLDGDCWGCNRESLKSEANGPPLKRVDCGRPLTEPCRDPVQCESHEAFEAVRAQAVAAASEVKYNSETDLPPRVWRQLDTLDLAEEFRKPVKTVREPPRWFRASLRKAYALALRHWVKDRSSSAWKLVLCQASFVLGLAVLLGHVFVLAHDPCSSSCAVAEERCRNGAQSNAAEVNDKVNK